VRPVDLRLRNFRSYFGDEAAFDFRDRRLVGIVGPIGSGKSTILDAISFALYGRTASVGRSTKALIHQRADHSTVAFRFSVDGELWEAQRMLRRKGASQHALYRLEDDTEESEHLETITGEAEVTARVVELLGLDFDAFGRSVMLAQGRFAEFLTAPAAERDKVLKGVFGHDRIDRMRALAKERAREAEIEAEKATVSVQHLAELETATAARKKELSEDTGRLTALEAMEPKVRELTGAIEAAENERDAAEQQLAMFGALSSKFPNEDELATILEAARDATERRAATAGLLEAAREEQAGAERRSTEATATRETLETAAKMMTAREERLTALTDAEGGSARAQERHQQAVAEAAGQTDRVTLAEREANEAAATVAEQTKALATAETAYHQASHANMASALRRDLHEGEPCPVCEQTVATLPIGAEGAADVEAAQAKLEQARHDRTTAEAANTKASAALESAKTAQKEAARRVSDAEGSVKELEERRAQAEDAAAAATRELSELLGSTDIDASVATMREELAAAAAALEAAATARDRARTEHDAAIEAEQNAGKRLADLRVALTGIASRIDDAPEVGDDAASISEAATTLHAIVDQTLRDTAKRRDQAATLAVDQRKALDAAVEKGGVTGSFDDALSALRSRVEVLGEEIGRTELQLEEKAEQVAKRDAHVATMTTHHGLAADLTDARFVRFLLDDERRRLSELGSEHFQLLTNGRYRFSDDGVFDIVDLTAADAVRKADSLSGGETFLASLGLALSLAEIVARGGGRLDAFFLDEGFGTLDPEHLDLAMEGIESLVDQDGDRVVVVVSHVPELRHRVEDLIVLDRSPTNGDTRILSG